VHALVASQLVRLADLENTSIVAHCFRDPVDQRFLDVCVGALDPDVKVLKLSDYARQRRSSLSAGSESAGPRTSLLGRSLVTAVSDDGWAEAPEELYRLTRSPADASDTPAVVEIGFECGVPVSINGVVMSLVELVQSLETIAGAHGVGRYDDVRRVENSVCRMIHELPAMMTLQAAHSDLQSHALRDEVLRLMADVAPRYAATIFDHGWFSPARDALDALVATLQQPVTGTSRVRLFKGDCRVVGRRVGVLPDLQHDPAVTA
jgi:argininosuccinate synthase